VSVRHADIRPPADLVQTAEHAPDLCICASPRRTPTPTRPIREKSLPSLATRRTVTTTS